MKFQRLAVVGLLCITAATLHADPGTKKSHIPHTGKSVDHINLERLRESKLNEIVKSGKLIPALEMAETDAHSLGLEGKDLNSVTNVLPTRDTPQVRSFGINKSADTKATTARYSFGISTFATVTGNNAVETEKNLFKSEALKSRPPVWIDFRDPKRVTIIENCKSFPDGIAATGCFDLAFDKIEKGSLVVLAFNLDEERKAGMPKKAQPPALQPIWDLTNAQVATITLDMDKNDILIELNLLAKDENEAKQFVKTFTGGIAEVEKGVLKEFGQDKAILSFVTELFAGIKNAEVSSEKNFFRAIVRYDLAKIKPLIEKLPAPHVERKTIQVGPPIKPSGQPIKPKPR